MAEEHVRSRADDLQRLDDQLSATHQGQPVEEAKTALHDEWRRVTDGGEITDPDLTKWATAISEGRKIHVSYGGIK